MKSQRAVLWVAVVLMAASSASASRGLKVIGKGVGFTSQGVGVAAPIPMAVAPMYAQVAPVQSQAVQTQNQDQCQKDHKLFSLIMCKKNKAGHGKDAALAAPTTIEQPVVVNPNGFAYQYVATPTIVQQTFMQSVVRQQQPPAGAVVPNEGAVTEQTAPGLLDQLSDFQIESDGEDFKGKKDLEIETTLNIPIPELRMKAMNLTIPKPDSAIKHMAKSFKEMFHADKEKRPTRPTEVSPDRVEQVPVTQPVQALVMQPVPLATRVPVISTSVTMPMYTTKGKGMHGMFGR